MAPEVAAEILSVQPVPFLANIVAQDGACDGAYLMTLLPANIAADAIVAAVVDANHNKPTYIPIERDEALTLIREGLSKRLCKSGARYWWVKTVGDRISDDLVYHQVRLILLAEASLEWKIAVLSDLGADFLAFASLACVDDIDEEGELIDRIARIDPDLGSSIRAILARKGYPELHADVLFLWEELGRKHMMVGTPQPAGGVVKASQVTLNDLVGDIV
jgi:hypothetical protein